MTIMTLDEIEQAIAKLSAEDRARLRAWLARLDEPKAGAEPKPSVDPKTEAETTASKLGHMAGRAFADFRKRMRDT